MSPKTKILLDLIKQSRKQVGLGHIEALIRDVEKLGRQAFLSSAADAMAPGKRTSNRASRTAVSRSSDGKHAHNAAPHPLEKKLAGFQLRTGYNRKTFLACLIDAIGTRHSGVKAIPKNNWSFPKFVRYYEN